MKVTYNWLKDFINLKVAPAELAEKLTMAGLEVVSLKELEGDFVFEIEITSNRPDWLSVLGIAREINAIYGASLKTPNPKEPKLKSTQNPVLSIENRKDCPFYSARIIRDVKVAPSPDWLKKRLESIGCRSVNNIVDITNYILFELGQPLHAFDLDKLRGPEITVRRAKSNERITIIDGQQLLLDPEILVIADKSQPVAIAGVMGGKETEVTQSTRNILLESAVFNPGLLRRGRQKLGLQSESVYRFERGVSLSMAKQASLAASELIVKFASGASSGFKSLGYTKPSERVIDLDPLYVKRVLGQTIPAAKIKQILSRLGLKVKIKTKNILSVKVGDFRLDLKTPIDLVEEVARIYGYEKITRSFPCINPGTKTTEKKVPLNLIKNTLCSLGLNEVVTYSLIDRNLLVKSGIKIDKELAEIVNPLSSEQDILRPTLLPSLIKCLAYNLNQQQDYVNIFEIANIFSATGAGVEEKLVLAIALCGTNSFLTKQGLVKEETGLLHLKGVLEVLFNKSGIKDFDFIKKEPGKISIILGAEETGFMLDLNSQALNNFDIKNKQVVLAQICLKKLFSQASTEKKFLSLPKYPAITRDISFLISQDVAVKGLLGLVKEQGLPLLYSAEIVDYYQGKQIPAGFTGLTISCVYRASDRTLTEDEVSPVHNSICSLLQERFNIKLR